MQVAERANASKAADKLAGPGGPFVLRLIDITWCGERASLCRRSSDVRYVDHQEFGATIFGKLCRGLQSRAGGGCSTWYSSGPMTSTNMVAAIFFAFGAASQVAFGQDHAHAVCFFGRAAERGHDDPGSK